MFTITRHPLENFITPLLLDLPTHGYQKYAINYNYETIQCPDLWESALNAAERVHQLASKKSQRVIIFYSGGTDSNILIKLFQEVGADPLCVTLGMENTVNDNGYALLDHCRTRTNELGIEHIFVKFPITEVIDRTIYEYYPEYAFFTLNKILPAMYIQSLADKQDYYFVSGEGDPRIQFALGKWWYTHHTDWRYKIQRYAQIQDITWEYEFFNSTPELFFAYHFHSEITKILCTDKQRDISGIKNTLWPSQLYKKKDISIDPQYCPWPGAYPASTHENKNKLSHIMSTWQDDTIDCREFYEFLKSDSTSKDFLTARQVLNPDKF